MPSVRLLLATATLIVAALALLFYVGNFRGNDSDLPSAFVGKPAPAVTEDALANYPKVTPDMLQGQVTLVNFWASWCLPCRAEHPKLLELAAQGIRIVGINYKDEAPDALRYLGELGNPYSAIAFDPSGRTSLEWGVSALPVTFILDDEGTVVFSFTGTMVGDDYDQRFAPELEKALNG